MAHTPRIEHPGDYHVVCRGNNKQPIFLDDGDRLMFAKLLNRIATRYGWTIFAYCLMGNHYHIVMRIGEAGMSRGMCQLNGTYALAFNDRHGRINHVFGRRYRSAELRSEHHFLAACRYVLQNPVRAGLVKSPDEYTWSSYRATIGLALDIVRTASDDLLRMFSGDRDQAILSLVEFCTPSVPPGPVQRQPP